MKFTSAPRMRKLNVCLWGLKINSNRESLIFLHAHPTLLAVEPLLIPPPAPLPAPTAVNCTSPSVGVLLTMNVRCRAYATPCLPTHSFLSL